MFKRIKAQCAATFESLEQRLLLATTYYVSPLGNNNAEGTSPATAWKTLQKVSQFSFGPGDQILLEGGESFSGNMTIGADDSGAPGAPIRIGSYGGGRATINSGTQQGLSIHNTDWIEVSSLVIVGSGRSTSHTDGLSAWNDMGNGQRLEHLYIDNVEVRSYGKNGIAVGGVLGSMGFKDVRITESLVHDNGINGITFWGWATHANQDVYIADVRAMNNPGTPGVDWVSGSGILIEHSRNVLVERCVTGNNGTLGHGGIGIWCYLSDSVTFQFNESYNNRTAGTGDGGGFAFDGGTTNSVMQYNYSHGNDGAGMGLYQFFGATPWSNNLVRYNVFENDGRRNGYGVIHAWNGSLEFPIANCEIYGNTVFLSPSSQDTPRVLKFVGNTTNFKFRNNNFVTTGGAYFMITNTSQPGLAFQGNNWWSSGGTFNLTWQWTNYTSLSSWRNASGHERLNGAPVGFSVNPMLTSPGNGGTIADPDNLVNLTAYKLLAGSPLINTGLNIAALFGSTPVRDFWGTAVPQGGVYDVGAHEFPGGPAPGFQESGGRVDMQAEAFTGQAAGSGNAAGHTWSQVSDGAAGGGLALLASPNTGVSTGDGTNGPRRDYSINFTNTGTYYVWVRLNGASGLDDSLHVGLDGVASSTGGTGVTTAQHNQWIWTDRKSAGAVRLTVNVATQGVHIFNLWMREDGTKVDQFILSNNPNFVPGGGGGGGFTESGGRVDFQAEAFTGQTAGSGNASGHTWSQVSDAAAGGGLALVAGPNTGVSTGDGTNGPRRDYAINFTNMGTYYVWVRFWGASGTDDSLHVGLNGMAVSTGGTGVTLTSSQYNQWVWSDRKYPGAVRVTVNVSTPGVHNFNLWMREDGTKVDQFTLTKDASFVP